MNIITSLLDIEDNALELLSCEVQELKKIVTLGSAPAPHFCPKCYYKMHSRGIKASTINHPVLQDGYQLVIKLKQRRWRCTNSDCLYESNEHFKLVNRYRRNTNASDLLILNKFRNLNSSAVDIAKQFHTSDMHVLNVFDRYIQMERLPLTDAISVDEVYLDMDKSCKYALVIQGFYTGDQIDIIHSRLDKVTEPYFSNIPLKERASVKYLISDMYNPYLSYVKRYFPNAVSVVDSFHVMQWLIHSLDIFLRSLQKEYKAQDESRKQIHYSKYGYKKRTPISDEVYILKKYRWLLLSNQDNLEYRLEPRYNKHFRYFINTFGYEEKFLALHPYIKDFRDLKEEYVRFNSRNAGNPLKAAEEIDSLIHKYCSSEYKIFVEFGNLLRKYKNPIINSFIMVERLGPDGIYNSRLSNGPIESLNRKVKDLKRLGRGFRNFEHMRNRFLFATRKNPIYKGY